jgi:hypothetical protein
MECEILIHKLNRRGTEMLEAMAASGKSQGIDCKVSHRYTASTPWLMSYGLGHAERMQWTNAHKASGGRLIGWDLGYWDRLNTMRLTIDADHPHLLIRDMPADRFEESGIKLRDTYRADGHILLIGMGVKSRAQFGYKGQQWELETLEKIKAAYPGSKIYYKPKKPERFIIKCIEGGIEDALKKCQLVVCRHSNVSIDACLANIPAICFDGAGRWLYSDDIKSVVHPDIFRRRRFLNNLAHWQYKPSEAKLAWNFIKETINDKN